MGESLAYLNPSLQVESSQLTSVVYASLPTKATRGRSVELQQFGNGKMMEVANRSRLSGLRCGEVTYVFVFR